MIKFLNLIAFCMLSLGTVAQNQTEGSLFFNAAPDSMLSEVYSKGGDLYQELGHHGPAIENEYLGLRIYFSEKAAIDVYSKSRVGLELREARWYPSPEQQKAGWGADYYKVGQTVGLGGVRLWDGEKVLPLEPVTGRTARVRKEGCYSYAEMLSEGVPYRGGTVDILVRVTVFSGMRQAKVEAFALSDQKVNFATGINYHPGQEIVELEGCIASWGLHPEDVAVESVDLGSAILYRPEIFEQHMDDGTQKLLVTPPVRQIDFWISSASSREKGVDGMSDFLEILQKD